jgi:archaellum biogenesis protein FlaJ (TadC family)
MENTRKILHILRFALLVSIAMYAFIAIRVPSTVIPNPVVLRVFILLAVVAIAAILVIRRMLVLPSEKVLAERQDDSKGLQRWRAGYIIIYALSESLAVYGVALHFLGFTGRQVAPFFLVGAVLLLIFSPRVPTNTW